MRADDAAAFAALDLLGTRLPDDVVVHHTRAPSPEDFLDLDSDGVCVVADAMRGVRAGAVATIPLEALADGEEEGSVSTHTFPLRDVLRIARSVLGFTPRGSFVGIGGKAFGLGADMSDAVMQNLAAFAAAIEIELQTASPEVP
ncbi:MAG: hydrogenase maturation protease [Anaerolineales bacterium]|nr:hydrogenase maturation protease [Anaerolineales bacterium]